MTISRLFALLLTCTLAASPAPAQTVCNPLVTLDVKDASLAKTLASLSREHGFDLSFPEGMDRTISVSDQLPLNRLVEKITRGTSTLLAYREVAGCAQPALSRVVVHPEGEQADADLPGQAVESLPVSESHAPREYIYIDNMEQYVEEVLLKKRKPDVAQMTPEQRAEFRTLKQKLKKSMKAKKKARAGKREKTRTDTDAAAETAGTADQ